MYGSNVPDDSICRVCESPWPDMHHVRPRSVEPSRIHDPTNIVPLCRPCHDKVHAHTWELAQEGDDLVLYEEGRVIKTMPPLLSGEERDSLMTRLHNGQEVLSHLQPLLPRLTEEELITVYHLADSISERSWQAKMHCVVDEWRRLVPLHFPTEDKVNHIHSRFGIKRAQIYSYLMVMQKFTPEELQWDIPMKLYVTAARTNDPSKWLEYAVGERADNPGYTATDLEADIKMAGGDLSPLEVKVWAECPECGWTGAMIKRRRTHAE